MEELAAGMYRWTAPHPQWRPTAEDVVSYALVCDRALLLIDPLLPAHSSPRLASLLFELDKLAHEARRVEILLTIPYHTRSAEPLFERYRPRMPVRIWGHTAVKKRFRQASTPIAQVNPPRPGSGDGQAVADGLAVAYAIGNPRRYETPFHVPALRVLVFGDAVVGTSDGLRIWEPTKTAPGWLENRFLPTLRPLAELDIERVLVTHGPAALTGGRAALRAALAAPPVLELRLSRAQRSKGTVGRESAAGRAPAAPAPPSRHAAPVRSAPARRGYRPRPEAACRPPARSAARRDRRPTCRG